MENTIIAFVNSINTDDISDITFLKFINKLNKSSFNGYSFEIKYIDFDEETENIKWIVILCKKNDNN
jgi:hypothetical protein